MILVLEWLLICVKNIVNKISIRPPADIRLVYSLWVTNTSIDVSVIPYYMFCFGYEVKLSKQVGKFLAQGKQKMADNLWTASY